MCSKILVIQQNFADIQYYRYGYIGTDTDTNITIGAPLIHYIASYVNSYNHDINVDNSYSVYM